MSVLQLLSLVSLRTVDENRLFEKKHHHNVLSTDCCQCVNFKCRTFVVPQNFWGCAAENKIKTKYASAEQCISMEGSEDCLVSSCPEEQGIPLVTTYSNIGTPPEKKLSVVAACRSALRIPHGFLCDPSPCGITADHHPGPASPTHLVLLRLFSVSHVAKLSKGCCDRWRMERRADHLEAEGTWCR